MNKHLASLLLLFISLSTCYAQWSEHYQWNSCVYSGFYDNNPFAGHNLGLFGIEDNTINKISKATILSDTDISATLSHGSYIYIGYKNGNIDIVNMQDYSTVNIPELKTNNLIQNKTINAFYLHNNTLYCASNSGVFVIDLSKKEIKTHYKIIQNTTTTNAVAVYNDSIYVATANGLFVANANNKLLEDQNNWSISHDIIDACSDITIFSSQLFIAIGTKGKSNDIKKIITNKGLSTFNTCSDFRCFCTTNNMLGVVSTNNITTYNEKLEIIGTITSYKQSDTTKKANIRSASLKDNYYAIADNALGLVTCNVKGENAVFNTLNGPSNNNSYKVFATTNGVYVLGGGLNSDFNNKNIKATIHTYHDNNWTTSTTNGRDIINICADPNNPDSIYASSWGSGIFKIENHKFSTNLHAYNSSLVDIFGGNSYVRVNAITYDNNSNLIVSNSSVVPGLWIKTPQNEWYPLSYIPTNNCHSTINMIHTHNNNTWLIISPMNSYYKGIFVFNTNGTIDDDSDDVYRAKTTLNNESRNYGNIDLIDSDGEIIASNVNAIAQDKSGTIWIGTDNGIVAFYDDATIFETPRPLFHRIKVPRNDGTNNADYLLDGIDVTAIAVDGANNKWLGTKTEGLFLINETGLKTIKHFNTKNSPLPTNEISSIAIHPTTGEVFISTPLGTISYENYINEPSNAISDIKAYPNPVRPEYNDIIKFKGFTHDCSVKITDISGKLVYETKSLGGTATWNKETYSGLTLKSGIYLIWATDKEGNESVVSKILLMK